MIRKAQGEFNLYTFLMMQQKTTLCDLIIMSRRPCVTETLMKMCGYLELENIRDQAHWKNLDGIHNAAH